VSGLFDVERGTVLVKRLPKALLARCRWATNPVLIEYHDTEWGVPVHDDRVLFEFLILEGAQAGLSWETILKKRENYRRAFDGFDVAKIARYDGKKTRQLMQDAGIVRNRLKIAATISNAQAFLVVQNEFGSFDHYVSRYARHRENNPKSTPAHATVPVFPTRTSESDAMSKDLKKRGFRFVGTTICYAFMQAVGMVDDHSPECFRSGQKLGHKSKG
jgi:DNA-3-methyladenine glycosylase I